MLDEEAPVPVYPSGIQWRWGGQGSVQEIFNKMLASRFLVERVQSNRLMQEIDLDCLAPIKGNYIKDVLDNSVLPLLM